MGFAEDIAKVADRVRKNADLVVGEEATKQQLILPFLHTLGYDIWDPSEVIPESIADVAIKKKAGHLNKVDYAIAINGTIVMLVEAKARNEKPEIHDGQLKTYFDAKLSAKVGICSNGVEYRFFTDLRNQNLMDIEPFFIFNLFNYQPKDLEILKLFHRDNFDSVAIKIEAEEMVFVKGMAVLIGNLLKDPSDELIRFLMGELTKFDGGYAIEGKITSKKIEQFKPIAKKAIQTCLLELMTRSLTQEMQQPSPLATLPTPPNSTLDDDDSGPNGSELEIVTTEEELAVFEKLKAITATSTTYKFELNHKDTVSYFGLNLGKTTWWFLRFYLTPKKKSFITRLSLEEIQPLAAGFEVQEVSASVGGAASRVVISDISDLDKLAPLLLKCYETEAAKH
ncbi:type I restriction endonuclease [Laspinema olomoucense]|uniref:type I restriction endonuclease n=1 Tax=Laspinema olomoucense TaxID=3231600 RepID=UPI0021BB9821|nr:type I restriction endonuclease [Laspinema sp. D3c]MCT7993783.1 type I restriction endonuclease [Laspinema sp. D3c]